MYFDFRENVRVSTVDSFQGQEKEVIIVSCVRAGGKNIGFLNDRKRVNVALTRAQHSLFIVGHRDTLEVQCGLSCRLSFPHDIVLELLSMTNDSGLNLNTDCFRHILSGQTFSDSQN